LNVSPSKQSHSTFFHLATVDAVHLHPQVDFGLSCPLRGDRELTGACGTPVYSAPEVFAQRYDGVRADLWSAGVVLYVRVFVSCFLCL
jgi:serine/threonine protein kinase